MARGESYISAKTANALVSDLAPTRLSPECLSYVNLILDEVLFSIVDRAGSIDPQDVKLKGVPALFAAESSTTPIVSHFGAITKAHTRSASGQSNKSMLNPLKTAASSHEAGSKSLARDAVNEAELELAAWRTAAPAAVRKDAFQQDRRGLRAGFSELPFPSREAADFLRSRVAAYSSLAAHTPDAHSDKLLVRAWSTAGGSTAPDIVTPASLYLTAIIECTCEKILSELGKVAMRNASSSMVESQDLYVCMCESETLWGLFKQLRVKDALESKVPATSAAEQIMTVPQPNSPVPSSPRPEGLQRIVSSSSYSAGVVAVGDRTGSTDRPPSSYQQGPAMGRASLDSPRKLVKMPSRTSMSLARSGESSNIRAPSVHSSRTSMDGGRDSFTTGRSETKTAKEEEFDALLTSGQTMKVSLTPSRLKKFDRARASATPPATIKTSPAGSPLGRHSSTFARSNSNRLKKISSSPAKSLEKSRSPRLIPRDEDDSGDDKPNDSVPGSIKAQTQDLNELLRSDPPWGEQVKVVSPPRLLVKSQSSLEEGPNRLPVLGRPVTIGSTAQESDVTTDVLSTPRRKSVNRDTVEEGEPSVPTAKALSPTRRKSVNRDLTEEPEASAEFKPSFSASDDNDTRDFAPKDVPRKRSSAADLADFFNNTAPPSHTAPATAAHGAMISSNKSDTADLVDFFKNTSLPRNEASSSSPPKKPSRIRSMIAKVIHKGHEPGQSERAIPSQGHSQAQPTPTPPAITAMARNAPIKADDTIGLPVNSGSPVHAEPTTKEEDAAEPNMSAAAPHHHPDSVTTVAIVNPRPTTLPQHQVLVFDPSSDANTDRNESVLIRALRSVLSPYYAVGSIVGKALRTEPWEKTCILLIVVSTEAALAGSVDAILRARFSDYMRGGGKIWSIGAATALFCRAASLSERKLLDDNLLFPGTMFGYTSSATAAASSGDSTSGLIPDDEAGQKGDIAVLERGPAGQIVSLGWSNDSRKYVAWTRDITLSTSDKIIAPYEVALAFLGIRSLEPVDASQSHWDAIDPALLKPTHPLPVMLLAHPQLDNDLPARVIGSPEIDANSSEAQVMLQEKRVTIKALRDTGDTFHVIDASSVGFGVEQYMQCQRLVEAADADSPQQKAIPLLLGTHEAWRPEWTPLFDFARYWSELDVTARKQGVGRKRKPSTSPDELGSWSIGDLIQYGEAVGSTQTMLDRNPILLYGLPVPYVSMASFQLAGRGRGRNQWLSPAGCLQFSILLKLPRGFPSNKVVFAQYIAALAICQGLDEDGKLGVRIKWPNDIYAEAEGLGQVSNAEKPTSTEGDENPKPSKGRAKLGGILVNSSFVKGEWHLVVGCGINVLNDLPTTSLAQLYQLSHERSGRTGAPAVPTMEGSLARILVAFEEIWDQFVHEKSFAGFIDEYTGRWLHTDQPVTLTTVKPHLPLIIKTVELNSGLLRCVRAESEGGGWGGSSYDGYEDRYSTPVSRTADRYVDLQPDGNSFDLMSGLIKQKV